VEHLQPNPMGINRLHFKLSNSGGHVKLLKKTPNPQYHRFGELASDTSPLAVLPAPTGVMPDIVPAEVPLEPAHDARRLSAAPATTSDVRARGKRTERAVIKSNLWREENRRGTGAITCASEYHTMWTAFFERRTTAGPSATSHASCSVPPTDRLLRRRQTGTRFHRDRHRRG